MRENVAECESKMKRNIRHLGMNNRCVYDPLLMFFKRQYKYKVRICTIQKCTK